MSQVASVEKLRGGDDDFSAQRICLVLVQHQDHCLGQQQQGTMVTEMSRVARVY
jgi:hypothetical protein